MPSANLDDIQIYYEERGDGETILLAPPSWWPCDTWNVGVVPFLSQRYRTIIFDCRGTGYSSKPDHGYTISQFAEDCAGLVEHLKISRCHEVGFALGGQIVQALAIARPDLVATATIAAVGAGVKALEAGRDKPETRMRTRSASMASNVSSAAISKTTIWHSTQYSSGNDLKLLERFQTRFGKGRRVPNNTAITTKRGRPGTPWGTARGSRCRL